jgi:imidazolonepropionase-like amidohydrolase
MGFRAYGGFRQDRAPAAAVIRMAAINAGLALKQNIGSVEAGKDADLIILAANPLESL